MAQRNVDRAEARADGRRNRPLEGNPVLADRLERPGRQRIAAVLIHDVRAGLMHVPVEGDARRLEDAPRRLGQLGTRAVARDEGHAVGHGSA